MRNIYIYIFFSLLLTSCFDSKKKENLIFIDVNRIKAITPNEVFTKTEINPLYTSDSSLISRIDKVIHLNNEIYILDKQQKAILIFDDNGRFSRKLRNVGRGPGQYLDIADFTINPYNNNIEFVDGRSLYIYDKFARFIKKIEIVNDKLKAVNRLEIINNDIIFFVYHSSSNMCIYYSRKSNKILAIKNIYPQWVKENLQFAAENGLYRSENEIIFFEAFSNKVYKVVKNDFILKYEWDFGKYNFKFEKPPLSGLIKSTKGEYILKNWETITHNYIFLFRHNIENNKYIFTDFFFNGESSTLLYNKVSRNYLMFKGNLSKSIYLSPVIFWGEEKLAIFIEPKNLKEIPKDFFSEANKKIIDKINISDNQVILILDFKKKLLENIH
jgi:hypothetical protein